MARAIRRAVPTAICLGALAALVYVGFFGDLFSLVAGVLIGAVAMGAARGAS